MKGNIFATIAKIGVLLLVALGILNVYGVVRFIQTQRNLNRAEQHLVQVSLQRQAVEGVLREFAARANSDTEILDVLKRHHLVATTAEASTPKP